MRERGLFGFLMIPPLLLEPPDRVHIGLKWILWNVRHLQLVAFAKGRPLQFQIVRQDHQGLQVEHIQNIISQQRFQRLPIAIVVKIIPQQDGEISIHIHQLSAVDTQQSFTPF